MGDFLHKDNKFYINGNEFDIKILKEFDPEYSLPEGLNRHYTQGKKHIITNGRWQVADEFPWNRGDLYIKSIRELMYLKQQLDLDEEFE